MKNKINKSPTTEKTSPNVKKDNISRAEQMIDGAIVTSLVFTTGTIIFKGVCYLANKLIKK